MNIWTRGNIFKFFFRNSNSEISDVLNIVDKIVMMREKINMDTHKKMYRGMYREMYHGTLYQGIKYRGTLYRSTFIHVKVLRYNIPRYFRSTVVHFKYTWYFRNVPWYTKVLWKCIIVHFECTMVLYNISCFIGRCHDNLMMYNVYNVYVHGIVSYFKIHVHTFIILLS